MKIDKQGRLMAKLFTAFFFGASFMSFVLGSSPMMVSTLLMGRCNVVGWVLTAIALFFFGYGWLTEEEP